MKTKVLILLVCSLLVGFSKVNVYAGDNSVNGALIGAGSGALFGQAIGRNTEATLIGTAVGSLFGYLIGNEMDKEGRIVYRASWQPPLVAPPPRPVNHHNTAKKSRRDPRPKQYAKNTACRDTKILATINGRPRTVTATVCRENGRWVLQNDEHLYRPDKARWQQRYSYYR